MRYSSDYRRRFYEVVTKARSRRVYAGCGSVAQTAAATRSHVARDFGIDAEGLASRSAEPRLTWASVGLFRAAMVADVAVGQKLPLTPLLQAGADAGRISAERYDGPWTDVGTVERLNALNTPSS
jgi:hypothetical protein